MKETNRTLLVIEPGRLGGQYVKQLTGHEVAECFTHHQLNQLDGTGYVRTDAGIEFVDMRFAAYQLYERVKAVGV